MKILYEFITLLLYFYRFFDFLLCDQVILKEGNSLNISHVMILKVWLLM